MPKLSDSHVGLLLSGGLDSCILLGEMLGRGHRVQPIYIRSKLVWEHGELDAARRYLDAMASPRLDELIVLDLPMDDLYRGHWCVTGHGTPPAGTVDEAVYLAGRNPLLIVKAAVWCRLHEIAINNSINLFLSVVRLAIENLVACVQSLFAHRASNPA